ncbi:pro-resilin [Chironomus tepperi]|uniref:pro-resilin n=1 Tax=Chironomus tepperi TaxID=113505 RepID=UPI00391FA050
MMKLAIVSTLLLAMALAEPPSSYLPPQSRNFNGNFGGQARRGGAAPRTQYGAPSQSQSARGFAVPRTNYGAPSAAAASAPSTNYGAPSAPSTNYGAPSAPSSNYGAPSAPSTNYGAPSAQDFNNFDNQRANSYQQAPSSQYGAPSAADSSSSYNNGYSNGPSAGGYVNGGYEEPAKYEFQYDVQDEIAGLDFGHKEQREGSVATGKYYVLLPDGRKQIVQYIADENGYRPTITYEDTGRYNNNAQQGGYDSNAQGFGGY